MRLPAKNAVREIAYRCELYKDVETGTILGFWTGEIDTWGKLTIRVIDVLETNSYDETTRGTIYLFPREIVSVAKPEVL